MMRDALHPHLGKAVAGSGKRGDSDEIWRARFVPGWPSEPGDVVEIYPWHGPTALEIGGRRIQPIRPAHERACTERRVELVSRQGQVISAKPGKVDGTMWSQLGAIDEYSSSI